MKTLEGLLVLVVLVAAGPPVGAAPASTTLRFEERIMEVARRSAPAFVFVGGGSGISIRPDGYVLTNHHVVAAGSRWSVRMTGGRLFRAEVIGRDPTGDLALLKLELGEEGKVPYVELGDSDALQVGDPVLALGNPFMLGTYNPFHQTLPDYRPSVSLGFVSALNRFRGGYSDAIQTDGSINPGNSGGPLMDMDGKVVGINGQIETRFRNRVNSGVGFAIPSSQIRRFLPHLLEAGGDIVHHGQVEGLEVSRERSRGRGAKLDGVRPGSSAEEAGFRPGDVIVAVDENPVPGAVRFFGILGTYPAGEEVTFRVRRDGSEEDIRVALDPVPVRNWRRRGDPDDPFLGVLLGEGGDGVEVVQVVPDTPASRAGLRPGDLILAAGGRRVRNVAELLGVIRSREPGDRLALRFTRDGEAREVEIILERRGRR